MPATSTTSPPLPRVPVPPALARACLDRAVALGLLRPGPEPAILLPILRPSAEEGAIYATCDCAGPTDRTLVGDLVDLLRGLWDTGTVELRWWDWRIEGWLRAGLYLGQCRRCGRIYGALW